MSAAFSAGQLVRETVAFASAVVVGMIAWGVAVLLGVSLDVVGVVFDRPSDHPYEDAWMVGSVVLAVVVAGRVWWCVPRTGPDRC